MKASFFISRSVPYLYALVIVCSWTGSYANDKTVSPSAWQSDFGSMLLFVNKEGEVTGHYPDYQGKITGQVTNDGRIDALWTQPTAKLRCPVPKEQSYYWGTVQWAVSKERYLQGYWTYCGDANTGGAWNAYQPSAGDAALSLLGTVFGIAGQVAGGQIGGGGVAGHLTQIAVNKGVSEASSALTSTDVPTAVSYLSNSKKETVQLLRSWSQRQYQDIACNSTQPSSRKKQRMECRH